VKTIETAHLNAVKKRLGVPDDLASCHTAEIAGYVIEGHVPASALKRLFAERPAASGLAVPGMPIGSPGMEGGAPESYEVVIFGHAPKGPSCASLVNNQPDGWPDSRFCDAARFRMLPGRRVRGDYADCSFSRPRQRI